MKTIIVIGALLLLVSPALAGNTELDRKEIYELKEKCSQSAKSYEKENIDPLRRAYKDVTMFVTSAYNVRLNACLVLQTNSYKDGDIVVTVTDILDNRVIEACQKKSWQKCEQLMHE